VHVYTFVFDTVPPYPYSSISWHPPPEETYSDVNIFGLQTVYVVVSTCKSSHKTIIMQALICNEMAEWQNKVG